MTLRYLKIFIAVYEYNSITKAATHLHLAQPSVSLAVKEIEEYFGTRLFERIGHRISPTEAGKEVYRYAWMIMLKIITIMEFSASEPALQLELTFYLLW